MTRHLLLQRKKCWCWVNIPIIVAISSPAATRHAIQPLHICCHFKLYNFLSPRKISMWHKPTWRTLVTSHWNQVIKTNFGRKQTKRDWFPIHITSRSRSVQFQFCWLMILVSKMRFVHQQSSGMKGWSLSLILLILLMRRPEPLQVVWELTVGTAL